MRLLSVGALVCVWMVSWAGSASASDPSGTAIAVVQATQALGQSGNRILQTSGDVYSGDQIVTGPIGQAQVMFRDNTKLVVGPNSRMVIDAFVYGGGKTAKEVSIAVVKGAFRFITGDSAKSAYTITTPTATIGVRGTEFDFNVSRSGLDLAVFSGQTRICDRRTGLCFLQNGGCTFSQTGRDGTPRLMKVQRPELDRTFPYIRGQQSLVSAFRVNTSICGIRRAGLPSNGGGATRLDFSPVGSVNPPPGPVGGGPGPVGGGGGGNGCGNCGNGVGNGGGNGTPNEGGGGSSGNGSGGTPGNSANSPGHNKP